MTDDDALRIQVYSPLRDSWVPVGYLARSGERTTFHSYDDYWAMVDRPVLGQVFEEHGPSWSPTHRLTLPTWFSHLLPEGYLRNLIAEEVGVNSRREFFLLSRVGRSDLPGAVRAVRSSLEEALELSDETDLKESDLYEQNTSPLLKFSLDGLQLKFSAIRDDRGRLTIPATGRAGTWIAKFPDPRPDRQTVPEAEFACLTLARHAGIATTECEVLLTADFLGAPVELLEGRSKFLAVERYDRRDGRPIHCEEFAQILDVPTAVTDAKYLRANLETIAATASGICGVEAVGEVIDRIVFNVLIGNGDAHAKNWAVLYEDGRHATLTPAYDLVPTVLYIPNDDLGLRLNGSKSFSDVRLSSFDRLSVRAGWSPDRGRIRAQSAIERTIEAWDLLRDGLTNEDFVLLTKRRDELPLVAEVRKSW